MKRRLLVDMRRRRGLLWPQAGQRRSGRRQEVQDLSVDELHRQRLAGRGGEHGQGHGGAQELRRQGRSSGPGRRAKRPAPDPADQRNGSAGRAGDCRLPDLADGAQQRGQERLRQGRDDHRLRRRNHRALRLQCLHRSGGSRTRHSRMAGEETQRQGQHRRDHRRARHLRRHAPDKGGEGGFRQISGHQDRRARRWACGARPSRARSCRRSWLPTTGIRSTACGCRSAATPPTRCRSRLARSPTS